MYNIQQKIISDLNLEFNPISLTDFILISDKMLECIDWNELVCWRFSENEGYSGWVLAEFEYDYEKDPKLKKVHLFHLFDELVDVLPFFTLPTGYEVFKEKDIWIFRQNKSLVENAKEAGDIL